ncbi:hypothetical protein CL652_03155 [bacterium]|nr:hypothetical protein [bacterium]|tara:strand:- start:1974 stop:2468 length:495 start_codon:yes stop_codon:yes gene_type:complete
MNKIFIWAGLALAALGLIAYGVIVDIPSGNRAVSQITPVESPLTVSESFYDFGDVDIFGGKVYTTYTLKNEGVEDVTIVSGITSCACTEGEIGTLRFGMHETTGNTVTIPAGEEKTLTAIYDPLAHGPEGTGAVIRELYLQTNSTQTPEVKLRFSANVVKNKLN